MASTRDYNGLVWNKYTRTRISLLGRLTNLYMFFYLKLKNIHTGKKNAFSGKTYFYRYPGSRITLGDRVRFNSARKSIAETILYRPCAISTLTAEAKIYIGNNVGATSANIICSLEINIGDNVLLGANTTIMDSDMHHSDPRIRDTSNSLARPVNIGDSVFIGMNSTILKGVTIGENSVIAANSLVLQNIPPNSIAVGNPCKVLMKRNI